MDFYDLRNNVCHGFCHAGYSARLSVAMRRQAKTLKWHGKDANKIRFMMIIIIISDNSK